MKAENTTIAWTPAWTDSPKTEETRGQVILAPVPPRSAIDGFAQWVYAANRQQSAEAQIAQVFVHFHTMVVRDGVDPKVAHDALIKIDEFREAVSPDIG